MRYLSVCSGIEAASVAWHPLGWEPVAFSEVDAFPSAVLKHHYPAVPNWGDMTKFQEWPDADVDVLVGGTPCQSFSVAGLRKGLDDPRGSLMLVYLAIARKYRPRWVVWENVPGVLSADGGRAFGSLLGGLADLGYGFAYRVLDAQYFGVAQRRKRVFVVGCLGDWRRAAAVLFERESLSGHPAPRREARQGASAVAGIGAYRGGIARESDLSPSLQASGGEDERGIRNPVIAVQIAPCISARRTAGGGFGTDFDCDGGLVAFGDNNTSGPIDVATACQAHGGPHGRQDFGSETFVLAPVAHAFDARQSDVLQYGDKTGPLDTDGSSIGVMTLAICGRSDGAQLEVREDGTSNAIRTPSGGRGGIGVGAVAFTTEQTPKWNADQALTLTQGSPTGGGQPQAVAFSAKDYGADAGDIAPTLRAGGHTTSHANGGVMPAVATHMAVRRLTPTECERLQGFHDGWTDVPYRGKPAADGPRYKALGNSMAVPVMHWIGKRIQMVEEL